MPKAKTEATFEKDLERLENLVTALEEGGLSLDDALKQFEEGIQLARRCEKALTAAEKKIEVLVKNAKGDLEAKPFDEDHGGAAESGGGANSAEEDEEEEGELLF